MYLISPTKKQYKANLHCHSTLSDGTLTPEELKKIYKDEGYSLLSITDHEYPQNHTNLDDEEFMTITGYEAYIRVKPQYDAYEKEIHLNLFAREPENETAICYNRLYCKYMPEDLQAKLKKAGSEREREYTIEYIREYINTAKENGYIVALNHPYWSLDDEESVIESAKECFSMEMCNYSSYVGNMLEYNGAVYDKILRKGVKIACHGADDNHNKQPFKSAAWDSFGSFAMIMPDEFEYSSVIDAMEKGEMYASMGPRFKEVSMEGNQIHIECSDVAHIIVYTGSKKPERIHAEIGESLTCADFEIDERAMYVRVSIVDKDGKRGDTRAYMRDELEF